ncbi:MBG domain-containing protein, partial [Ruminococcaceae bacterium OttesenSCG-928-L11]|nr:MBG domain-containing protein [Ruminococcaceae bacterium OttesenSCG-928-L11]
ASAVILKNGDVTTSNYELTLVEGTLTVNPKKLDFEDIGVKPKDDDKEYGSKDPDFELENWPEDLDPDDFEVEIIRKPGEDVGDYEIIVTITPKDPNYEVEKDPGTGTFTITPKAVTITVDDKTKVEGSSDPELTSSVSGLIEGDTLDYSLSREEGEAVGSYPIVATPDENPNYEVTVVNGTLTITASPVTPPRPGDVEDNDDDPTTPDIPDSERETRTFTDPEVPLAALPEKVTTISDEEIPLAGGTPIESVGILGALMLGIGSLLKLRKKKDDDEA